MVCFPIRKGDAIGRSRALGEESFAAALSHKKRAKSSSTRCTTGFGATSVLTTGTGEGRLAIATLRAGAIEREGTLETACTSAGVQVARSSLTAASMPGDSTLY